jgi:hypothetical protein
MGLQVKIRALELFLVKKRIFERLNKEIRKTMYFVHLTL